MKLFKNIDFDRLTDSLTKTREKIVNRITETLSGRAKIDDATIEELEDILISSDVGYNTALEVIERTRLTLKSHTDRSKLSIIETIKDELIKILEEHDTEDHDEFAGIEKFKPFVILVVGVNGAGKTTTVGKMAYNYKKSGLNVVIGSADTFRAAANEQLDIWAKRAGVEIVQKERGSDPSSVAFDTMKIAMEKNADVVIIDTAGRLHTKHNLMEELKKIKKVIGRILDYAPNETYLVLDGNTGQNALIQANEFSKFTQITGLIITKLDGTAKGGVIFQICSEQKIPVRYIGVGEAINDLQNFDSKEFVNALFS